MKIAFKRIVQNNSFSLLELRFQTELIYLNFNEKIEKLRKKLENFQSKMIYQAFGKMKFVFLEKNLNDSNHQLLENLKNDSSEKNNLKQQEILIFDQQLREKETIFKATLNNMQLTEKELKEKEKIVDEYKNNTNKIKKFSNLFEKIEGIETQVRFF